MLAALLDSVDAARAELIGLAQDLVRLETVNSGMMPTGGETVAARFLAERLRENSFDDVELLARDPERANLVARLPGESAHARLLLLGHSDVVPAGDLSSWTHPAFGGEVVEGRLYGRGASDMKGTVAAEMMALILMKRAGVRLRHSVVLATVADEEAGGAWGMEWLAAEHPERVRADVTLNEGGGHFTELNGQLCCVLGLGEKGRHEAVFEVGGRGAHAAQPWWGENAFYRMAALLQRIEAYEPERRADLPLFDALRRRLPDSAFPDAAVTAENVDRFAAGVGKVDPALGSVCRGLSRLTIVPSVLEGGSKSNSVPDRARLRCDLRSLPSQDRAYLEAELRRLADGVPDTTVSLETTAHASASPLDAPVVGVLTEAVRRATGQGVEMLPGLLTGFTDSRFARGGGALAYGCTPGVAAPSPESRRIHGADEWTAVEDLVAMTRFFIAAAFGLDGLERGAPGGA